jgi:uncharacterized protein (TIGR03067 family)
VKLKLLYNAGRLTTLVFFFLVGQLRAELPPDAQEAMKKGIIAAKQQDYLLAIRYFQDAQKIAPDAPEIFFNLGLAESKIPGRELRAIAWFGAYLCAAPNAPNAAAVKDQIDALDIKDQSNLSHLIQSLQDSVVVNQAPHHDNDLPMWATHLTDIAELWARSGDMTAALKIPTIIQNGFAEINQSSEVRSFKAQGASAFASTPSLYVESALYRIARGQAEAGDFVGAQKTADKIQDNNQKDRIEKEIAGNKRLAGLAAPDDKAIKTQDWVKFLDYGDVLDSATYPASNMAHMASLNSGYADDPHWHFEALVSTTHQLVFAQISIDRMLKQQAKEQVSSTPSSVPDIANAPSSVAVSDESQRIQGSWSRSGVVLGDIPIPADSLKSIGLKLQDGKYEKTGNVSEPEKGTYVLDTSKNPVNLTMTCTEGANAGQTILGICQLDGDTFRICVNLPGTNRPASFVKTSDTDSLFIETYKRSQP